jgi:polyhydroxybutyrate depolymerase
MESSTRFNAEAETRGFLAAYPNGVDHYWNAGFCCPRPAPVAADDVGFLAALIDEIGRRHSVDARRVYVAGFSNGGYMAYRLACALAGRLAAVAAVGADSQQCLPGQPASPVSILHVHGTADNRNQGRQQVLRDDGTWAETVIEAPDQWRDLNGCPATPSLRSTGNLQRRDWQPCSGGSEVTAYAISGGGHVWSTTAPDVTRLVGEFFQAHKRSVS